MGNKWSDSLVRKKLSGFLLETVTENSSEPVPGEIMGSLAREVLTKDDLKALKSAIRRLAKYVDEDTIEALREEYDEIKDDLGWAASRKGKAVLAINDWVQGFYEEFRSNAGFSEVSIGGHASKNVVFVVGRVSSPEVLKELESYVAGKEPPLKVLYEVRIGA